MPPLTSARAACAGGGRGAAVRAGGARGGVGRGPRRAVAGRAVAARPVALQGGRSSRSIACKWGGVLDQPLARHDNGRTAYSIVTSAKLTFSRFNLNLMASLYALSGLSFSGLVVRGLVYVAGILNILTMKYLRFPFYFFFVFYLRFGFGFIF